VHRWLAWVVVGVCAVAHVAAAQGQPLGNAKPGTPTSMREYEVTLAHALAVSPIPRDRMLSAEFYYPAFDVPVAFDGSTGGAMRRAAAQAAPRDFLLQWVWSISNPRASGCDALRPCPERVGAAARVQSDNAAAWLPVLDATEDLHDEKAAEDALVHMAGGDRYEEPLGQLVKAWLDVFRRFPPPPTINMRDMQFSDAGLFAFNAATSATDMITTPSYNGLFHACSRSTGPLAAPQHFAECASIARLMLRANTITARWEGRTLLILSGEATEADRASVRSFLWQIEQLQRLADQADKRFHDNGAAQEQLLMSDWAVSDNEIEMLHRRMSRVHVSFDPPAGWEPKRDGKPIDPLQVDTVFVRRGY